MYMNKSWLKWGAVILLVGLAMGWWLQAWYRKKNAPPLYSIREASGEFKFIRPLLAVGDSPRLRERSALESSLANLITKYKQSGSVSSASVYVRDLEGSRWVGINEDEKYAPASMYKVALMIAYLKTAESDPSLLSRSVVFSRSIEKNIQEEIAPEDRMQLGMTYTIADLIYRLIIHSDNDAKNLLHQNLPLPVEREVFMDLGLPVPDVSDRGDTMSAKAYSLFFRILYNSSYLSRPMSEMALKILSNTTFREGIIAGVPEGTVVSHKYGYRVFLPEEKQPFKQELHDCGIVYYPSTPYFLCVMTKGNDYNQLKELIKKVSEIVYKDISQR